MASPQDRKNPQYMVTLASQALSRGNLPLAWNLASELRNFNLSTLSSLMVLGRVAETVGVLDLAAAHYQAALDLSPRDRSARADLARVQQFQQVHGMRVRIGDVAATPLARRHVIRAWGFGFCSELDNVLGNLLLADITGREPVVWWGESSIFRNEGVENAWCEFFEPIGDVTALKADLAAHGLAPGVVFPPKWTMGLDDPSSVPGIVSGPPRNITGGEWSRMGSVHFVSRGEAITVGDYFIAPVEAHTWAPASHWSYGKSTDAVYRVLVDRYLRPTPQIARVVDELATKLELGIPDRPVLGVHVRESDKILEDSDLAARNAEILDRVRTQAAQDPRLRVLLITDSEPAVARYQAALPGRVITVDAVRTSSQTGVHTYDLQTGDSFRDRKRLGEEVVRDIYLASRCERFIGVGSSNVSAMIPHLRDWPKGTCVLVGENMHHQINVFIHVWDA